ncbi:MAG: TetR/AcrR family transcriptional regulator [Eubacteriaceae bacterium]|nr:TetR/AcrR family transcriptional regulator [Eubacteriaceae bacterium]
MPPKTKITKEDILNIAFEIVRQNGIDSLNARNIAKALHCSTQPVFSHYENMSALRAEVYAMASKYHTDYFDRVSPDENIFLNVSVAYVDFALEEPHLFRFLFMSDSFRTGAIDEFMEGDCNKHISQHIPDYIDKSSPAASATFTDMWLYAHGIATMLVMNQINITKEEVQLMLTRMCHALINDLKYKNKP